MAITINKQSIDVPQRGGTINLIATYTGGGTYQEPKVIYFVPSSPMGRKTMLADKVITDKIVFDDKEIEFDHKIDISNWEIFDENIDIDSGATINPGISGNSGWVTVNALGEVTQDVVEYEVVISPYTNTMSSASTRMAAIMFGDDVAIKGITVVQGNGYMPVGYPNNISGSDDIRYRIKDINGKLVYEGVTTYGYDTQHTVIYDVNRVFENYIYPITYVSNNTSDWNTLNSGEEFMLYQVDADGNEVLLSNHYVCYDWSDIDRGRRFYNKNMIINDPINNHLAAGMVIPFCIYNADDSNEFFFIEDYGGGNVDETHIPTPYTDFCYYNLEINPGLKELTIYNLDFDDLRLVYDTTYCGDGYLLYRNRYGGWDTFLIEGNIYKYDNYTRDGHTNRVDINGNPWQNTTDIVNISTTYECSTGWLTEAEADRLVYHLLSSTCVFYRDMNGDSNKAVRITNTQAEYKKFKNGRKLIRYDITFEESKTKKVK